MDSPFYPFRVPVYRIKVTAPTQGADDIRRGGRRLARNRRLFDNGLKSFDLRKSDRAAQAVGNFCQGYSAIHREHPVTGVSQDRGCGLVDEPDPHVGCVVDWILLQI